MAQPVCPGCEDPSPIQHPACFDDWRLDDLERTLRLPSFPEPTPMNPILTLYLVLPNWTNPPSYRPFWAFGEPEIVNGGDDDVFAMAEVELDVPDT